MFFDFFTAQKNVDISESINRAFEVVKQYPDNDETYFKNNIHRYKFTLGKFLESTKQGKILDIGCHYLHQAMLFSFLGFEVWGLDVSEFVRKENIQKRAKLTKVRFIEANNLGKPNGLNYFKDNAFDNILFAEILEHITFNPISLWKEMYRVLRPGGKIILTTPNYYYLPSLIKKFARTLTLSGGYMSVEEIFSNVTFGHHWKEYSVREIKKYFTLLSKDFSVSKIKLYNPSGFPVLSCKRAIYFLFSLFIRSLQKNIYAEILLKDKSFGIGLKMPEY